MFPGRGRGEGEVTLYEDEAANKVFARNRAAEIEYRKEPAGSSAEKVRASGSSPARLHRTEAAPTGVTTVPSAQRRSPRCGSRVSVRGAGGTVAQ